MKTMNHVIPSTNDGSKILVEDGQPVEFGQTLVLLNKKCSKSFDS